MRSARAVASTDALRSAYLDAILAPDVRRARTLISDAIDAGADVRAIYLEVLQPALHEVGRLRAAARIGVAEEHLATAVTQSVLARLAPLLREREGVGRGRDRRPAAVALSAAMPERLPLVRDACLRLRALQPAPLTLVGGQGVLGSSGLRDAVCADGVARDAAEAAAVLARRLAT